MQLKTDFGYTKVRFRTRFIVELILKRKLMEYS